MEAEALSAIIAASWMLCGVCAENIQLEIK